MSMHEPQIVVSFVNVSSTNLGRVQRDGGRHESKKTTWAVPFPPCKAGLRAAVVIICS